MYINKHNNLLLVVSFVSSYLFSSTSCRTSLFSFASKTRYRLDNICVFDVFNISIARSMHRWVDLFVKKKQIDVYNSFKKRTYDAIVTLRTTKRYVFMSSLVVLLTFRQCLVLHKRYWRKVDASLNFAEKATFSNAKNVESTNVRAKIRALLRIINAQNAKINISRIQKNFLIDIYVNLNRFCDIQQSILNVKWVETRLKFLILSKNENEKSKSKSKTTFSSRSNSSKSSFSKFVWLLFVALMRKKIRWKWHYRNIMQRSRKNEESQWDYWNSKVNKNLFESKNTMCCLNVISFVIYSLFLNNLFFITFLNCGILRRDWFK